MNVTSIPAGPSLEQQKIAQSCREFEGVVWRQILEKSLQPLLHSSPQGGADKTGSYGYLVANALAEAVSGGPNSFAALLQSQLAAPSPPASAR